MSYNVLLGIPAAALAGQAADLMAEDGDLAVVGVAVEASDVMDQLGSEPIDVVVLHEDIGPLPVMDLAREVGQRYPQVSIVLVGGRSHPGRSPLRAAGRGARRAGSSAELRGAAGRQVGRSLGPAATRTGEGRGRRGDGPGHRGPDDHRRGGEGWCGLLDDRAPPCAGCGKCGSRPVGVPRRFRPAIWGRRGAARSLTPAQRVRSARCRPRVVAARPRGHALRAPVGAEGAVGPGGR